MSAREGGGSISRRGAWDCDPGAEAPLCALLQKPSISNGDLRQNQRNDSASGGHAPEPRALRDGHRE